MTIMKVIRGTIIADWMSFRVATEEFRSRDFGLTRLEVARKLIDEHLGLEVEEIASMQVVPAGDHVEIRLRSK